MTFWRTHFLRFLLPLALVAGGAALAAWLVPGEMEMVKQQLAGFPDSDVQSHAARPWVLAGLCFLPALVGFIYALSGTMDRYIARQFGGIFCICLSALLGIWLIMDLADKVGDLRESKHIVKTIAVFYGTRSPAIFLLLLPYSLLLALLYSLGKLSGTREVISMIQGGRSVIRITLPLIVAGVIFSLLSLGLNYQWAPVAEGNIQEILAESAGQQAAKAPPNVLYRNPMNRRLWRIGVFPPDYYKGAALLDVEVTTTRPDQSLESRLTAKKAYWDRATRRWTFEGAMVGNFPPSLPPVFETHATPLIMDGWRETPWQLIKPGLSASFLGIPDLTTWLRENSRGGPFAEAAPYLTQWHYRFALPFGCMVTVLLATPLAIHFSRRGPGGGIFLAVVLSALMLLVTSISLALGEAGTLRPVQAAWLPNAAFALLGLYFFRRRITGKPIYLVLRRLLPSAD
jgi:lipopolysaccharide export system permease protein